MLSIHQGNRQTARPGTTLAPLYVRLRCTTATHDMPPTLQVVDITDEDIAWRVTSGGGTLSTTSTKTNVDGFASSTWTLGPDLGPASIEASYARAGANRNETISVRFDATTAYPSACGESGGVDHGAFVSLDADTTWRAADNPNRAGIVVLGAGVRLTIEPGAVVCAQQIGSPTTAAWSPMARRSRRSSSRWTIPPRSRGRA